MKSNGKPLRRLCPECAGTLIKHGAYLVHTFPACRKFSQETHAHAKKWWGGLYAPIDPGERKDRDARSRRWWRKAKEHPRCR